MRDELIQPALALFREACELPEDERPSFLDIACSEDAELRGHVESMLACDGTEHLTADGPHPVRGALSDLAHEAENGDVDAGPIPETIGGYRIVSLIAQGGMGVVYEAQQEHPQRRVAIKVAQTGTTGSATTGRATTGSATTERGRRFELEVQLLARLQHPGIAQIIEAGTTSRAAGAQPYFVMEFVEGQSLTDYATAHLRTPSDKLELMVRVCDAVGFAHQEGVTHRDLKPDNVFVEACGQPKVLDFGIAKVEAAGGFGAATLRTEVGRIVGTLGYMAPEQLGGKTEGLGPEADVYSLGVLLYELLSDRLPHELDGVTLTRALAVVTNTDAPLLGVIRPEYRGDIEAVVAKALEKDHRYRYADAGALKADIERYLHGEPTLARPAGPLRSITKWSRRNPALATAVAGLFLAISTVAAVLLVKNQEVEAALTENQRLLDTNLVKQARSDANAEGMWPTRPEQVPALEQWLATYRSLVDRIPDHQAAVDLMRADAGTFARETWTFTDRARQEEHDVLVKLVRDLRALEDSTGLFALKDGTDVFGRVEDRLQLAQTIVEKTIDDRRADWDAAIDRIRNNPDYHGLILTPQVGLIPLGQDPVSKLEEFLHVETHLGAVPPASNGERIPLEVDGGTGLVFVLIPRGSFWMGAEKEKNETKGNNFDKNVNVGWERSFQADIVPFFLSKYEMTQGQWQRSVGENPSQFARLDNPVNWVSFVDCERILRRLGLDLPDEEQWEYAARAGTKTAFWTGPEASSLAVKQQSGKVLVHENIAEQVLKKFLAGDSWWKKSGETPAAWFDEKRLERIERKEFGPAPVGTYEANAFGLFDVGGNVAEWCSIGLGPSDDEKNKDKRPKDKRLRQFIAIVKGGSFKRGVRFARSASRQDYPKTVTSHELGLRPVMEIQAPGPR